MVTVTCTGGSISNGNSNVNGKSIGNMIACHFRLFFPVCSPGAAAGGATDPSIPCMHGIFPFFRVYGRVDRSTVYLFCFFTSDATEGSSDGDGTGRRPDVPCAEGVDGPGDGWRPPPPSGAGVWMAAYCADRLLSVRAAPRILWVGGGRALGGLYKKRNASLFGRTGNYAVKHCVISLTLRRLLMPHCFFYS